MRPIDADALKQKTVRLARHNLHSPGVKFDNIFVDAVTIDEIDEMPTIEKRKIGHWIRLSPTSGKCSDCSYVVQYPSNYCPNCGADMRGE